MDKFYYIALFESYYFEPNRTRKYFYLFIKVLLNYLFFDNYALIFLCID